MRRDHRQPAGPRPFDRDTDRRADVTDEFWGATRDWEPGSEDGSGDAMWAERTGSMRVIREGMSAFKPRRGEPTTRNRTGGIDRTRSHGIVRPQADVPTDTSTGQIRTGQMRRIAPEASLAELADGRRAQLELDWPDDDDWSLPDSLHTGSTSRVAAVSGQVRAGHVTGASPRPTQRPRHRDVRDHDDDADLIPLSPTAPLVDRLGLGAIDPLLVRLGAIVLVGVLAVPFALASRGGSDDGIVSSSVVAGVAAPSAVDPDTGTVTASTEVPATAAAPAVAVASDGVESPATDDGDHAEAAEAQASDGAAALAADDDSDNTDSDNTDNDDDAAADDESAVDDVQDVAAGTTGPPEVAVATEDAERVEPDCTLVYTAVPGDSWYRIADAAGVSMQAVLDANLAGVNSVILPGDEICLPQGATLPSSPTTTSTTAPTTTGAPTTTSAPTTTAAPPPAPASTAEVQRLVREIWPDELEEKALQIAWRESNYKADAYNGICCYGVFQIHWTSHRSWLDDYGIATTNDLFDARKNITAAYALYQRSGGWGPWGG